MNKQITTVAFCISMLLSASLYAADPIEASFCAKEAETVLQQEKEHYKAMKASLDEIKACNIEHSKKRYLLMAFHTRGIPKDQKEVEAYNETYKAEFTQMEALFDRCKALEKKHQKDYLQKTAAKPAATQTTEKK